LVFGVVCKRRLFAVYVWGLVVHVVFN